MPARGDRARRARKPQAAAALTALRSPGTRIAHAKAYGALALGLGSRALHKRAEEQPYFVSAVGALLGGDLVPVPGGVLVRSSEGHLVGAVGISGDTSDNDEAAAVAGIEAANLRPEVG
jgi:uncharacterized protein GlcG (DUF336 family)